jgi:hypothetical protein
MPMTIGIIRVAIKEPLTVGMMPSAYYFLRYSAYKNYLPIKAKQEFKTIFKFALLLKQLL